MAGLPHASPKLPPAHLGRGAFSLPYPPNILQTTSAGLEEPPDTKPVITMITPNVHNLPRDDGKRQDNPSLPPMFNIHNDLSTMSSLPMPYFPNSPPFSYQGSPPFTQVKTHPTLEKVTHITPDSPPSESSDTEKKVAVSEINEMSSTTQNQSMPSIARQSQGPFFRCAEPGCGKVFTTAATLSKHVQTHTGERPFECHVPFCGKSFKTATYLTRHLKVHNIHTALAAEDVDSLKYKCTWDGCERSFVNKHALHRHMDTHSTDRPFACHVPNCGKTFKTKGSLKQHGKCHPEGVNIDQTPFKCTSLYCGKAFNTKGQLKIHLETHLYPGLRPYECAVEGCSKAFKSKGSLRQHEVCHRDDRPYMCPHVGCPKTFKTAICRDQHIKTHKSDVLLSSMSPPAVTPDLTLSKVPRQQTPEHLQNHIIADPGRNIASRQPLSPADTQRGISMEQSVSLVSRIAGDCGVVSSGVNTLAGNNLVRCQSSAINSTLHGARLGQNNQCANLTINNFLGRGLGNIAMSH